MKRLLAVLLAFPYVVQVSSNAPCPASQLIYHRCGETPYAWVVVTDKGFECSADVPEYGWLCDTVAAVYAAHKKRTH